MSQEHRLHGKGPPRVPQLSFTSQRGFLLLPPPGTPTDKRRIKTSRQTPQERASHSHMPMGCVQKSWSGKGSPRQAGGDGDDQGRRVTHAQSRCRDSRAGARTHGPELPILFTLRFSSAARSGIRFENRLQLQNPQGGPRKKKKSHDVHGTRASPAHACRQPQLSRQDCVSSVGPDPCCPLAWPRVSPGHIFKHKGREQLLLIPRSYVTACHGHIQNDRIFSELGDSVTLK